MRAPLSLDMRTGAQHIFWRSEYVVPRRQQFSEVTETVLMWSVGTDELVVLASREDTAGVGLFEGKGT